MPFFVLLLVVGSGAILYSRLKTRKENSTATYKVESDGSQAQFIVNSASFPSPMAKVAASAFLAFVGILVTLVARPFSSGTREISLIYALMMWAGYLGYVTLPFAVGSACLYLYYTKAKFRAWGPTTITVSNQMVESTSMKPDTAKIQVERHRIHRLILRNVMTNAEAAPGNVFVGSGLVGGAAQLGAAVGEISRNKAARVGWQLNLEAGGKAYPLAWGLDEITAYGLLKDVSESLALTVVTF